MKICCTQLQMEYILSVDCPIFFLSDGKNSKFDECEGDCPKCFADNGIKFEIEEDISNA